ncbi:meiosis regulator and mRNA stability factor 1 isoform X1 [Labeo rohita]|uniref:meiosis regulator and mRNA stability factor 1 isoform X1 n=1 Tax=Labeo rohita TaxID=84645 RepID=UPI0021E30E1D|nr:meiosis regulator and mRNA stability factor 1 isoform X1 [Labeo rohita]XP_050967651.1 meiosis regulator and mRNA stability factor 1 isoform X1 [Labeo rohita]
MEVRKPVLELKDVPPPPLHGAGAGARPSLGPPRTQPGGLSVSVCSRCEASIHLQQSSSDGTGGGFPLFLSQTDTRTAPHPPSLAQSGPGATLRTPASFGTPSAAAGHCHAPCCASLRQLHVCSLCKLAPSGVCHCRGAQQHPFSHGGPSSPSHLCSNSLHLAVGHAPPCAKGARCLQDCWRQSLQVDSEKVWPNIPPPVPVPVPVAVCNGCGVTGASSDGLLGVRLGKTAQKYGPPESEAPPPIGVFWDIENCAVPSGRSAATVVQRLRERFFQGHREAEFICVCDINKENKAVIQELNNCQVTVAHINATAKNAADDKLRQSLRRFAETHAAPATVIVVSSDVNFASELSDLRHRHGFQVILVHKSQASSALLQHAHLRVPFEEFVSDLPPGMVVRSQPSFSLLFVHHLPTHRDAKAVANRLQRLSNNCGGKVLGVSGGCAVLRFASAEAAERARKRMENEDVLGHRIVVSFSPDGPEEEEERGPPAAAAAASSSSSSVFLPVEKPRSPRRLRRASRSCQGGSLAPERPYSPRRAGHASSCSPVMKPLPQAVSAATRPATASPQSPTVLPAAGKSAELSQRSRRRDSPGQPFQVSTPSAFSKLSLHQSFSPMMLSQSSWSSRSASPCLSNRSSPLSAPSPSSCADGPAEPFSDGVDVQVTNLDYRMSRKDLQQILRDAFAKHGRVKSVDLSPHTDYQLKARVHMSSLQQAIGAVSLLHRYKIGSKRIHVSLVTGAGNKSLTSLSSEIVSILQDAPANCLPLYKFTETYERKFGHKLVVSDLYRLPEVVCVREQGGGRLVCLLSSTRARQSPLGSAHSHDSSNTASPVLFEELEYHEPVCKRHCTQQDFSESDFDPDSYMIPFVLVSLKVLAAHVHSLLQSHEGTVPLLSFPECYAAEFSPLTVAEEGKLEGSVPLEHLITCIPGVTVVTAQNGFKVIKWIHNKPPLPNADPWLQRSKSPVGNPQLIQFSREMVDLMKNQPSCLMPITKFIPAYHHHFAKQCRVSDYGYSKLLELLEAVPHVLQILGLGSKRLLTLTHRAQIKRFTQDLLKLLKFQASKQVVIRDFTQAYHWCFSRNWQVVDYGMCDLMDLLAEIPDTTITVSQQDEDTLISVPKRERTAEEVERTRQFGKEVVDLLRHQPHFRMPFSKFIPTYHHHFGRQCKLSYYGFTKLMELFEAIPDVLLVLECGEERVLALTEVERVKALAAQLVKLLRAQRDSGLPVSQLLSEYNKTFGYSLRLQDYDAATLPALLNKLCHVVKVTDASEGKEVQLINRKSLRALTSQLLALMMSLPEDRDHLGVEELRKQYELTYAAPLNPCEYGFISLTELLKSLPYLLQLSEDERDDGGAEERVRLTRLYRFARGVRALLHTYHYNQIFLSEFCGAFSKYTGLEFQPQTYGYKTLEELLAAIPQVVWIKGHGHKKIIVLKNDMRARGSPALSDSPAVAADEPRSADSPASGEMELLCLGSGSPVDLLCAPVPSCLPSPQLRPDPVRLQPRDLIRFEPHPHGPSEREPVLDRQPRSANGRLAPLASGNAPEPSSEKTCVADSPSRRTARNKVKLAANFSFASTLSV